MRYDKPMGSKRIFIIITAVIAGIIIITAIGFSYMHSKARQQFLGHGEMMRFLVAEGDSARVIAEHLQREGLASKLLFMFYIREAGISNELKAGTYELRAGMSVKEIADAMARGDVFRDTVKITIPEGFTLLQIEERSGKSLSDFTVDDFRAQFDFLLEAPEGATLEGYLFPDTYEFERDITASEMVSIMLGNFAKKWDSVRALIQQDNAKTIFDTLTVSLFNIVTMASLIQEEVITEADMKLVSGVLWKRYSIGMPLQVDATVSYAVKKQELTYDDLKTESPYNTYRYKGLPKGPIASPGLSALEAAVYPTDTEYLYYLSKPNKETVFSRTLAEHNKAKALYLR